MQIISRLLSSVICCLTVVGLVAADEPPKAGVIQVQVTGPLLISGTKPGKEWVFTGWVRAEGRDLKLDCSANATAQKLIVAERGNPDPFRGSSLPIHYVEVKGRLTFRPSESSDDKGKRADIPVIVVESLKIVEQP